ncbi:MAG: nucleoside phosphorylase [Holosporaceae bacterium]|jgi:uridine phosphorylase|nr:nucleoside phosphorylase [Holosporaceae bacterium]
MIENKCDEPSFVSAEDFVSHIYESIGAPVPKAPENIVAVFHPKLFKKICESRGLQDIPGSDIKAISENIGLVSIGIGAPYATVNMEELIVFGAKNFIFIGTAGGLQESLRTGDFIIPTKALRDEGVSRHYLKEARYSEPSNSLCDAIAGVMDREKIKFHVGAVWSTDALYRETQKEIFAYKDEGILAVEMEDAALYAVAQYRGVNAASVHMISDVLCGARWEPHFGDKKVRDAEVLAVDIAIKAFSDFSLRSE